MDVALGMSLDCEIYSRDDRFRWLRNIYNAAKAKENLLDYFYIESIQMNIFARLKKISAKSNNKNSI